jgi:hypothetical protein
VFVAVTVALPMAALEESVTIPVSDAETWADTGEVVRHRHHTSRTHTAVTRPRAGISPPELTRTATLDDVIQLFKSV